ncbi:hypothetical protein [Phycicoccus flavus]|uniref:Uncharacterized protein n=1 Tax=Phycicoccus flavus TaxID=2502783 RepID=A0A8T6R507_9MICO|nr:hypothetical protein [Phycicoccus flavus]NHA68673.1 hypothetical protein [Phycicoccus flavus]
MTLMHVATAYLAVAGSVALVGAALAFDSRRSMRVRSAAVWTALFCLVWPLTLLTFAGIAVVEHRRRPAVASRHRSPLGIGTRA